MSILIADDDAVVLWTLSSILERRDYDVTVAMDGVEAIERAEETPFDFILMDINMPRMDGVQAYKKIKPLQPDAVVMMMTAHAPEELVQEVLEAGVNGILYKPFAIDEVISAVGKARQIRK